MRTLSRDEYQLLKDNDQYCKILGLRYEGVHKLSESNYAIAKIALNKYSQFVHILFISPHLFIRRIYNVFGYAENDLIIRPKGLLNFDIVLPADKAEATQADVVLEKINRLKKATNHPSTQIYLDFHIEGRIISVNLKHREQSPAFTANIGPATTPSQNISQTQTAQQSPK